MTGRLSERCQSSSLRSCYALGKSSSGEGGRRRRPPSILSLQSMFPACDQPDEFGSIGLRSRGYRPGSDFEVFLDEFPPWKSGKEEITHRTSTERRIRAEPANALWRAKLTRINGLSNKTLHGFIEAVKAVSYWMSAVGGAVLSFIHIEPTFNASHCTQSSAITAAIGTTLTFAAPK